MMLYFLLVLLSLLITVPAFAAVAVDANSESGCTNCISDSWLHTVTGANTVLVCSSATTDTRSISSFTHNSLVLTQHATATAGGSGSLILEMWRRIAPTAGTQTVAITLSGTAAAHAAGCTSFTGAHQVNPLGTALNDGGTNDLTISPPTVTVPSNGLAYDAVFFAFGDDGCATPTPGGSQTLQFDVCGNGGANASMILGTSTRVTTGTMSWSNLAAAYERQIAVPINEAAVGAGSRARHSVSVVE